MKNWFNNHKPDIYAGLFTATVVILIIIDLLVPIRIYTTSDCSYNKSYDIRRNIFTGPYKEKQIDIDDDSFNCTVQSYKMYLL